MNKKIKRQTIMALMEVALLLSMFGSCYKLLNTNNAYWVFIVIALTMCEWTLVAIEETI